MSEQIVLKCSNLSFRYGEEVVIENLSFEIHKHSHSIIKGESGSGKSTLLKLLLDFLTPHSGDILFQYPEADPCTIRQYSAWLPQDLDLGDGTVKEVIQKLFSFKSNNLRNIPTTKIKETLGFLGLAADNLDKPFRDLSTGQRQRVGIAICHLLNKPILLLDEPTSALDYVSKQKTDDLLINSEKTIISASHDPFWVDLADNVIELN